MLDWRLVKVCECIVDGPLAASELFSIPLIPYKTCEVAGTLVVKVIVVLLDVILLTAMFDIRPGHGVVPVTKVWGLELVKTLFAKAETSKEYVVPS